MVRAGAVAVGGGGGSGVEVATGEGLAAGDGDGAERSSEQDSANTSAHERARRARGGAIQLLNLPQARLGRAVAPTSASSSFSIPTDAALVMRSS